MKKQPLRVVLGMLAARGRTASSESLWPPGGVPLRFGVPGSGFRVQGSGFRVQGSDF